MTPQDREQAGEYVLGLLDSNDLAAFERRLDNEPDLAHTVQRLQDHLQRLDDTARPQVPAPALWDRIAGQLDTEASALGGADTTQVKPANDNGWRRWMATAAGILASLAVGYLAGSNTSTQPQPVMIAVLLNEQDAQPAAIVEAYADDTVQLLPLEQFSLPQGRVFQVWTLPDVATGPVSLGTFETPGAITLARHDLPPPQAGQLYEITLEPLGGSPSGKPTGPILVKGFAKAPL